VFLSGTGYGEAPLGPLALALGAAAQEPSPLDDIVHWLRSQVSCGFWSNPSQPTKARAVRNCARGSVVCGHLWQPLLRTCAANEGKLANDDFRDQQHQHGGSALS
jgi:hypothetical protein